jgi:hypothetical protein
MTASGTLIALLLRMTALLLLSSAALGTASAAAAAGNWSCAAFNCTCKGMGDYYGVQPGVGFGCAPPPAEEWWNAKKCPVSAGCAAAPGKPCCCTGLGCPAVAPGGGRTCTKSMPCESCTCRPAPAPALPTDPNASGASELARNVAAEREHSCVRLQLLWLLRPARARTLCGRRRRLVQWESAVVRKTISVFNFAPFQS